MTAGTLVRFARYLTRDAIETLKDDADLAAFVAASPPQSVTVVQVVGIDGGECVHTHTHTQRERENTGMMSLEPPTLACRTVVGI